MGSLLYPPPNGLASMLVVNEATIVVHHLNNHVRLVLFCFRRPFVQSYFKDNNVNIKTILIKLIKHPHKIYDADADDYDYDYDYDDNYHDEDEDNENNGFQANMRG